MSTLNLSNASFLSVNSESNFVGELNVNRVETLSVRGFIDKRTGNDDYAGVREVLTEIVSMLANNDDYWVSDLTINGHNYGKGRVTSLNFDSSPGTLDNMITLGEYSATIEIYKQGDLFGLAESESGILGHHYPTQAAMRSARHEYLQDFSFNTTWDDSNGDVSVNENVAISYISGDAAFNPKVAARNLANSLLGYSSGHLSGSPMPGGWGKPDNTQCVTGNYSEEYDDINLNYNFGRTITFYGNKTACPYQVKSSRNLSFDQNGNIEITEKADIFGTSLGPGYMGANKSGNAWGANEGMRTELGNSYSRCNTMFNNYTGLANQSAKNVFSLSSTPIEIGKSIDSGAGVGSFTVRYTNNQRLSGSFINEWNQSATFDQQNNVQIVENGTIREFAPSATYEAHKRPDFNAGSYGNHYNTLTTSAENRAKEFYDKFVERVGIDGCSNKNNLKLIEENREQFFFGPNFSYSKTYSDDPSVLSDADAASLGWKRVEVVQENSVPIANSKEYLIPRQGVNGELVQIMDQVSLGTLTINIQASQRAPQNYLLDNAPPDTAIKKLVDNYALPAAHALPGQMSTKVKEMWVSDVNYSFNSQYDCNLVVTISYTVENYL